MSELQLPDATRNNNATFLNNDRPMTPKSRVMSANGSRAGSARGSRKKGSPSRKGASPY